MFVYKYEFQLIDNDDDVVQRGTVDAGKTHTGAAWATLARAVKRPETGWEVHVRRIGKEVVRKRIYVVGRSSDGRLHLERVGAAMTGRTNA